MPNLAHSAFPAENIYMRAVERFRFGKYALSVVAFLAACGGSQSIVAVPGASSQTAPTAARAGGAKDNDYLFVDSFESQRIDIVTDGDPAPSLEGQLAAPGWKKIGSIIAALSNQPTSNWVDKHGNLYVPNFNLGQAQVTEYGPSGTAKFIYRSNMEFPGAVTTDAHGNVFEADELMGINEYHQGSGTLVATCPQLGGGERGIAVDSHGNVFASFSTWSGTGGIAEYTGGLTGCSDTVLNVSIGVPGGIVLDKNGNLVVCDETNEVVDIIDPPYTEISAHLGKDYGPFQLRYLMPAAVSINKDNTLAFVTDWANQTVDVVTYPGGEPFAQVGSNNGVSYPTGAVDGSNYVP